MLYKLRINNRNCGWSAVIKRTQPKSRGRKVISNSDDSLFKRAKRQNASLLKFLTSINSGIEFFVTLNFPLRKEFINLNEQSSGEAKAFMDKLERRFRYTFDDGFYVWVFEYGSSKRDSKLHCHMLVSTGEDLTIAEMTRWFRRNWFEICDFFEDNAVDVKRYDHGNRPGCHIGYVTKQSKREDKKHLIKHFGHAKTWGTVCRKNISVQKDMVVVLTSDQMEVVRNMILTDIRTDAKRVYDSDDLSESSKRQKITSLKYKKIQSNYCLHFHNSDLTFRIILAVKSMK